MERLTAIQNGMLVYAGHECEYGIGMPAAVLQPQHVRQVLTRLAAYENTGMEPEEIEKLASVLQTQGSCETCIRCENRRQCPMSYGESAETCLRERLCGCHDCQNGSKWVWRGKPRGTK